MAESKFKKLSKKIQKQWHTKKEADAIAASIWRKKYWRKTFNKMASEGRRKTNRRKKNWFHL